MPVTGADKATAEAVSTADVLAEVNQSHGTAYQLTKPLLGGMQSGTWMISDLPGTSAVLKWSPERSWAAQIQRAARAVAKVRQHGYPTPAWLAVGSTSAGYGYQVQEFVAGRPVDEFTVGVAEKAIDLLELHSGLDPDPDRSWSTYVVDQLIDGWTATTAAVSATGAGGRALVETCAELLTHFEVPTFPSSDLVHGDFRLGNVLFDQDQVSGVVDIEALGTGTRAFDYATLLDNQQADEGALHLLVEAGSQVAGRGVLAYCLAHVLLDLALFLHRQLPTADPLEPDRRGHALAARARLVSGMLL